MHTLKEALKITLNKLTKEELVKQYLQLEDEFASKSIECEKIQNVLESNYNPLNDKPSLEYKIIEYNEIFYQILADFKSIRSVLFMQNHYIQNNKKELNRDMLSGGINSLRNSINYIENDIVDRTGIYN